MLKITRNLKLRQNYSSVLEDNSKLFIKPIEQLGTETLQDEFLIQKDGKVKQKQLYIHSHIIKYSKKKQINVLNATLILLYDNQNELEGLKLLKGGISIDIYKNTKQLFECIRKFCIQRDIPQKYKITQTICYGSNATFLQLQSSNDPNFYCVAKVYEKLNLQMHEQIQSLKKEVQILRLFFHPNLPNLIEVFEDDDLFFLIMEELKGDNLQNILERGEIFTEQQIKYIIQPIFECVSQLNEYNIFHRDIKPQNIQFKNQDRTSACLMDFSLADFWNLNGKYLFTRCGSVGYVAPEVLQDKKYFLNIDVFSIGIILYILLTSKHPFDDPDKNKKVQKNYHGKIDLNQIQCSSPLLDLLKQCLDVDFCRRLNAKDALKHQFFQNRIPKFMSFKIKDNSPSIRIPRSNEGRKKSNQLSVESGNSLSQSKSPSSFDSDKQFSRTSRQQNSILPEISIFRPKSKYYQFTKIQNDARNPEF